MCSAPQRYPVALLACLAALLSLAAAPGDDRPAEPIVYCLAFSADGARVLTGGDKLRVFEVATGKKVHEIDTKPFAGQVAFSPGARPTFAAWHSGNVFRFWDAAKPAPVREIDGLYPPTQNPGEDRDFQFAIDPAGKYLARSFSRYGDRKFYHPVRGDVRLWDLETGKPYRQVEVEGGGVQGLAFSSDGALLAFVSTRDPAPPTLEVYRPAPWAAVASIKLPVGALKDNPYGAHVCFVPGGNRILVAGGVCTDAGPGEVPGTRACRHKRLLWTVELGKKPTAELLGTPREHVDRYSSLAVAPDGKTFVTDGDGPSEATKYRPQIEAREVAGGKLAWNADGGDPGSDIRFSPDGKFVGCVYKNQVRLLDAGTGKLVRTIDAAK